MNLKQLEYFVSVAETLNFTRAARKCFISQTAMTQQIRALEESIGVLLFIRDKHHVELTPAGRVFMYEAKAILSRSEEAVKLARSAAEGFPAPYPSDLSGAMSRAFFQRRYAAFMKPIPIFPSG